VLRTAPCRAGSGGTDPQRLGCALLSSSQAKSALILLSFPLASQPLLYAAFCLQSWCAGIQRALARPAKKPDFTQPKNHVGES